MWLVFCEMVELALVFVLVIVHGMYVSAQKTFTCGNLSTAYGFSGTSINCAIRLIPSTNMSPYIRNNLYRWNHYGLPLGSFEIINKETNSNRNPHKYSESNFTLHIHGLTREDEGEYLVECRRITSGNYYRSPSVIITLPETSTSETTTVQINDETKGLSVIVVALCVVVVVMAVVIAIVIANRRKRAFRNENQKEVNHDHSSIGDIPGEADGEPVYNEVDIDQSVMSEIYYADMHVPGGSNLHQNLLSRDISPRRPVIPNNGACNDDYANICRADNTQGNPNDAMSTEWPKPQNNTTPADEEEPDHEYYKLEPNNDVATD